MLRRVAWLRPAASLAPAGRLRHCGSQPGWQGPPAQRDVSQLCGGGIEAGSNPGEDLRGGEGGGASRVGRVLRTEVAGGRPVGAAMGPDHSPAAIARFHIGEVLRRPSAPAGPRARTAGRICSSHFSKIEARLIRMVERTLGSDSRIVAHPASRGMFRKAQQGNS